MRSLTQKKNPIQLCQSYQAKTTLQPVLWRPLTYAVHSLGNQEGLLLPPPPSDGKEGTGCPREEEWDPDNTINIHEEGMWGFQGYIDR